MGRLDEIRCRGRRYPVIDAVTIGGRVSAESQHQALLTLIENQPGAVSVNDHIVVGAWA